MTTRMALAGALALGAVTTSAHAQQLATDRVEALMIAGDRGPMPTHEERLAVDIDGEHAHSTLLGVYTNDTGGRIEGQYHLRPGSGSHVDGFAYWNGEAKIVGEVFERETARKVYNNVTARRRDPGLLEEDGEGAFEFKVFPIEPHENKRVEVSWSKWLERHAQTVHYRAPVNRRDAEIVITIAGAVTNVRSATHKLHVEKLANGVRLRSEGATSPGELDLEWDIDEPAWTPDAYVQPNGNEEGWFSLSLAAPRLPANTVTAKDLTIVIDRSGSMDGDKLEHAKLAASGMIRMLDPGDRVNVISFSDEVDPLFKTPQPIDGIVRGTATGFITRLHAGGGTDIALALSTAVQSQERSSERPQVVVFLTDGQSDAQKAAAVDTGSVRLFTLGLGADVNKPLLSRLAAQRRGRFVFIEDARSIEPEVARLAATIAKPLLVDVSVEVDGVNATRIYPRSLPDLFAEDELRISGRVRGTGTAKFIIRGKLGGKPVELTRSVDLAHAPSRPWIGELWAQARIDHLLEEISLGNDKGELRDEVLELALAYNFVTPYTAFLAVPESELGGMRDTVMAARERKQKILANNPDVTGATIQRTMVASVDAPSPKTSRASDDRDGDEDSDDKARVETIGARRHGCAGCELSGAGNGTASLLLVGLTVIMLRRRRA